MITFDTIGLNYDLTNVSLWAKNTINANIDKYSRYGLTTLFFDDKISSVQVLFNNLPDIRKDKDVQVYCEGEDFVRYKDKQGNKRTEKTRNLFKIPSWSYQVNMRKQNNEIRVEFSIPKYLYGHNLNLFPNKEYYHILSNDTYYGRFKDKFSKDLDLFSLLSLQKFVYDFTFKIFGVGSDIFKPEVYRLDLSYNYRFSSAEKKQDYINRLNEYFMQTHKILNYGNKTFTKVTQQYSVKIYDKEVEFNLHDYKELQKYYSDSRLQLPKDTIEDSLSGLSQFSMNVMRCEITLRKNELKELFFRNAKDFQFDDRALFLELKPLYDKVVSVMRSLNLIRNYLRGNHVVCEHYDYRFNQISGRYEEIPIGLKLVHNLEDRKIKVVRKFLEKYQFVLSPRYLYVKTDFLTNDESIYDWLERVLKYVQTKVSQDNDLQDVPQDCTVNLKYLAVKYAKAYEKVRDIEKGWSFYLDCTSSYKKYINIDSTLLRKGFEKLKGFVNTFSKPSLNRDDLLSFLRKRKKDIKIDLGINSTSLIPFVIDKFTLEIDKPYYGYPKRTYFRHEANLQRIQEFYKMESSAPYEKFDLEKYFENTPITTQICCETQLMELRRENERNRLRFLEQSEYDAERFYELTELNELLKLFASEKGFLWKDIKRTVIAYRVGEKIQYRGVSPLTYFRFEFGEYLRTHSRFNFLETPKEFQESILSSEEYRYFLACLALNQQQLNNGGYLDDYFQRFDVEKK